MKRTILAVVALLSWGTAFGQFTFNDAGFLGALTPPAATSGGSAPVISNVSCGTPTSSGMTITWNTAVSTVNNKVQYSIHADMSASSTATGSDGGTSHSVPLTGLTASTVYYYQVQSDANSQTTFSSEGNCTTAAGGNLLSAMNPNFVWLNTTNVTLVSGTQNVTNWVDCSNLFVLKARSTSAYPTNNTSANGGVWFTGNGNCYLTNLSVPAGISFSSSGNWTLAWRSAVNSGNSGRGALSIPNTGDAGVVFGNPTTPSLSVIYGATDVSRTLVAGTLYSIMLSCSSGTWTLYTNGVSALTGTGFSTWVAQCVGNDPTTDPLTGYIQKMAYWTNSAKTQTDATNWHTFCVQNNP